LLLWQQAAAAVEGFAAEITTGCIAILTLCIHNPPVCIFVLLKYLQTQPSKTRNGKIMSFKPKLKPGDQAATPRIKMKGALSSSRSQAPFLHLQAGVKGPKGAFTLGVRDTRVESRNTMASHLGLKPSCHENFLLS